MSEVRNAHGSRSKLYRQLFWGFGFVPRRQCGESPRTIPQTTPRQIRTRRLCEARNEMAGRTALDRPRLPPSPPTTPSPTAAVPTPTSALAPPPARPPRALASSDTARARRSAGASALPRFFTRAFSIRDMNAFIAASRSLRATTAALTTHVPSRHTYSSDGRGGVVRPASSGVMPAFVISAGAPVPVRYRRAPPCAFRRQSA